MECIELKNCFSFIWRTLYRNWLRPLFSLSLLNIRRNKLVALIDRTVRKRNVFLQRTGAKLKTRICTSKHTIQMLLVRRNNILVKITNRTQILLMRDVIIYNTFIPYRPNIIILWYSNRTKQYGRQIILRFCYTSLYVG